MKVTLRDASETLGYSVRTLQTYKSRSPDFPAPVGMRGQAKLYDLETLTAWLTKASKPVRNRRATRLDDGNAVTCLECGARRRSLAQHLQTHGLDAATYIAKHNLPRTTALQSRVTRERHAATMTPDRAALMVAGDQQTKATKAAIHTRTAHKRVGVADARKPGQAKGVAAMESAHRARMDTRMRALGYRDLPDAVAATNHLPVSEAARLLSSSKSSIRRWRDRFQE